MKRHIATLVLSLLSLLVLSQNKGDLHVIHFQDKGNSRFSLNIPDEYLSERAIERRLLQEIPLDETDIPVNESYLQSITDMGAMVIYTSKWLNVAIAHIDSQDKVNEITSLPFINKVEPSNVLQTKRGNYITKRFFDEEKFQEIEVRLKSSYQIPNYVFNYGVSGNQARMIKVDQLHQSGYTGKDMIIAVIDAGFNSADIMDVFDSLRINGLILGTRDFVQPGNNLYNTNISTHGTMVLSTMGGNLPGEIVGTAPHASYYLMRSEDATAEYLMEEYYWVSAAEYADSLGVDILSTSLGYSRFDNIAESHTYSDLNGDTTPITIAADLAAKKGMLVINSAGNEGDEEWQYISAPADGDSVLSVGAVGPTGTYAVFSSIGPTADGRIKPDVVTQGMQAVVANIPEGVFYASGTSFSAPILSGAAACLWQANPTMSNMELLNAIKQSGSMASNPNNQIGFGIPDFSIANSLLLGDDDSISLTNDMICYPNPFTSYISTNLNILTPHKTDIILINSSGKLVKVVSGINLVEGSNRITLNNLDMLPKGIYYIQFSNGLYNFSQKVIK